MGRTYGAEQQEVKPIVLSKKVLESIGRLVRACAEIEDIIDLFIATLAEISETKTTILLGKTAISRRLEIALELAKIREDKALECHKAAFGEDFADILDCRNAVAHGKLLGKTKEGLAFLTSTSGPVREDTKIRIVMTYQEDSIHVLAKSAEERIPQLEKLLQVEKPRAERLLKPLLPHSKAQPRGRAKPQPQHRSSGK